MSGKKHFEDLIAWQKSRELVRKIHLASGKGLFSRDYNLKNQIRRASVSAMSNIAEGFEREGDREFIQYLSQAKASCGEVRSQLYIAYDLGYLEHQDFTDLSRIASEASRVISGLMGYLKNSELRGSKFT